MSIFNKVMRTMSFIAGLGYLGGVFLSLSDWFEIIYLLVYSFGIIPAFYFSFNHQKQLENNNNLNTHKH